MSNLKKSLETQKQVNDAVEEIFEFFREESSYSEVLQSMVNAQTQIMMMLDHVQTVITRGGDPVDMQEVIDFIWAANQMLKLMKPFAIMLGQVYTLKEEEKP